MFYKIRLQEDVEKISGVLVKNGYIVKRAKKKKGKGYDYGIEVTGNGEDAESEEEE
jgi:hypothetical protein